jgi:uncharacterized membrane protein
VSATEAVSEHTAPPQDHSLSYRDRALILTVAAILVGVLALAAMVTDAAMRDRIPDSISDGLSVLAGTVGVMAVVLWTRATSSAALGALAAEMEQISAKLAGADLAFDYGRRYEQTVTEPGSRPRLVGK